MNLTSKSRYALKIMMDLAHYSAPPSDQAAAIVRRSDIARRQGIPTEYLDQIMIRLRSANLVESVRGRSGGYRLGRAADRITLWDVFAAVEDGIYPVECVATENCGFAPSCITHDAWSSIFAAMREPLVKTTLAEATDKWADEHRMCPAGGIRECRGS
ncbi:MAG: Fe-S cluster assembly transcriptional regulator IscR [Pseudomonadota bacterium]